MNNEKKEGCQPCRSSSSKDARKEGTKVKKIYGENKDHFFITPFLFLIFLFLLEFAFPLPPLLLFSPQGNENSVGGADAHPPLPPTFRSSPLLPDRTTTNDCPDLVGRATEKNKSKKLKKKEERYVDDDDECGKKGSETRNATSEVWTNTNGHRRRRKRKSRRIYIVNASCGEKWSQ